MVCGTARRGGSPTLTKVTTARGLDRLQEQLRLLDRSVQGFLAGEDAEALRVATTLRVLVHDNPARGTHALLKQVIPGYEGILIPDKTTLYPASFRSDLRDGKVMAYQAVPVRTSERIPHFDVNYECVPLREWWSEIPAFITGDEKAQAARAFTRKELVLILANKEGGAHVDPDGPPESYVRLITERPIRVSGSYVDTLDIARWTVVQSGAELLEGLRRQRLP